MLTFDQDRLKGLVGSATVAGAGLALLMTMGGVGVAARGAVVADLALTSGTDAIDPSGGRTVGFTPANATLQGTLEGYTDFGAIHTWTGFVAGTNIASFTDSTRPAIRFTPGGAFSATTGDGSASSTNYSTSPNSFVKLDSGGAGKTLVYTIDFGTYVSSTFTPGAAPVQAAGFTISDFDPGTTADFVSVAFRNGTGTVLSTQTATYAQATGTGQNAVYFGWDTGTGVSAANAISSIEISYTTTSDYDDAIGLDDLGFTQVVSVPEPASLGLGGLMGLMMLRRRRGLVE